MTSAGSTRSTSVLSSLITERLVSVKGLGVRLSFRCAEDGLKGNLRVCDEHAKESFAVFDSTLIACMFKQDYGRPFVCFKTCS